MEADRKRTGKNLLELRKSRGFSLRKLASQAGCSAAFISQIERGQTSPSLESLKKICRVLKITLIDLLSMNQAYHPAVLLPRSEPGQLITKWPRASLHYLLPSSEQVPYSVLILELPAKGRTPLRASGRAMKELGLVLKGEVFFDLDTQRHELSQGDSIYFDLTAPHQWRNTELTPARVLLFNPNFTEVKDLPAKMQGRRSLLKANPSAIPLPDSPL